MLPPGTHSSPTANPEGSSTTRGSPPPHVKGKKSGYKKGHGTALCPLPLGGLITTLSIFSSHSSGYKPTLPTTRSQSPCSPLGSEDKGRPGTPHCSKLGMMAMLRLGGCWSWHPRKGNGQCPPKCPLWCLPECPAGRATISGDLVPLDRSCLITPLTLCGADIAGKETQGLAKWAGDNS